MKFTTLAIVATFFSLVVANPATNSVGNVDSAKSYCAGSLCHNGRTGETFACCEESYCNYVGFKYGGAYCT